MSKQITISTDLAQLCINMMAKIKLTDLTVADNMNVTLAIQELNKITFDALKKEAEEAKEKKTQ